MFGLFEESHESVYGGKEHESKFSHELVAGAASFEAMKLFEDRQRKEGKPVSHKFAKEMLAGIAGGEVDKLFESKGLNFLDREKAKHQAQEQVMQGYDSHYGGRDDWRPEHEAPIDYQRRY